MRHLLILVLLAGNTTLGQDKHYGIKLDLNLSGINGKGMSPSVQPGLQVGTFFQKEISRRWSIQPEILYTHSNVKKSSNFLTYYNLNGRNNKEENIQLNYLSIPVLVHFSISSKFSVHAGPQYGYLFHTDENLMKYDIAAFKKYAFSGNMGVQYHIGSFAFSARYNRGISNINDIDRRYRWRATQIQVGFAIKFR
ncbi:MAG: PorT family protein [Chitinophagaceae bacterium]|nr:PorT family protein [Chitinophagaceae bacterium]